MTHERGDSTASLSGGMPRVPDERVVRKLAEEFRNRNVVVLCGAGVSLAAPTSLPSGAHIKDLFLDLVRDAIQLVGGKSSPGLARERTFPAEAMLRMPERVLEQFHNVFGDDLFTFLDPFFAASATPNHNHKNLAKLAAGRYLTDIITVNFDFALETAFFKEAGIRPTVYASSLDYAKRRDHDSPLAVHKAHGTIPEDGAHDPPSVKYAGIRYTVQRIGTALDDSLVGWLRDVIGDRSVFVTGYSADDLDVFPALQQAVGRGRVYWNWYKERPSILTKKWLGRLGPQHNELERDVDEILGPIVDELRPPRASHDEKGPKRSLSLDHIHRDRGDAAGVVLAAALICHDAEARKHAHLRDKLIECLEQAGVRDAIDSDPRRAVWFGLLTAGRDHEKADTEPALQRYLAIRARIEDARQQDKALPEWVERQVDGDIAYNEAWPLKRPDAELLKDRKRLLDALRGLLRMLWRASAPFVVKGQARSLASHFLGEFPLTWAMAADIAAPKNPLARVLYAFAHWHFRRATTRSGGFFSRDVFHQMRRDEARLLLLRSQWFRKPRRRALREIDASLQHYRYLNGNPDDKHTRRGADGELEQDLGAMGGDAARGVHLLLEATRSSLAGEPEAVRRRLDDTWRMFIGAKYGSGLFRVQMYEWLLDPRKLGWWQTLPLARIKRRHALRLREWYSASSHKLARK